MNWNFLDIFEVVIDVVELISDSPSSANTGCDGKPKIKEKSKYLAEKISSIFLLISAVLLFFAFKDHLPEENYIQTLVVASLIGLAIALIVFFILYTLEKYYFKNVFQWLFFSVSTILFFISMVLTIYFKSGLF